MVSASASLPDPGLFPLPELAVARHPAVILAPRQLKRWVDELPLANPPRSADLVGQQLRLLVQDPQPGPRLAALLELYRSPLDALLEVVQERLHMDPDHALPLDQLEYQVVEILKTLGDGYLRAFNEALLVGRVPPATELYRAAWAFDRALGIERLRYRQLGAATWQRLLKLFLCAEHHSAGDHPVATEQRADDDPTTLRGIFFRTLIVCLSDPYHRRPGEILRWTAWTTDNVDALELSLLPAGTHAIPVDISGGQAPLAAARRARPGPETRYLLLDAFLHRAAEGAPDLHEALIDLARGRRAPEQRGSPRKDVDRPYRIVCGLRNIFDRLQALSSGATAAPSVTAWPARQINQSKDGAAFVLPSNVKPPLTIGEPVLAEAVEAGAGGSPVGFAATLQRLVSVDGERFEIGVEKLRGRLIPVTISAVGGDRSHADPHALLLQQADAAGLVLLASRAWYRPDDTLAVEGPATRYRLRQADLLAVAHNVASIRVEPDNSD